MNKPYQNGVMSEKLNKLSKQQLLETLLKKKECNIKAQKVVETLLERTNNPDDFVLMIKDINQNHYDDIVEERFILKLCGYPLCEKDLVNVPQKKYHISISRHEVYDLTERKKFCSTQCFKASQYIKLQILTSPLWLRNPENLPKFKLLTTNNGEKSPSKAI